MRECRERPTYSRFMVELYKPSERPMCTALGVAATPGRDIASAEKCSTFHGTLAVPNFGDEIRLQDGCGRGGVGMQTSEPALGDPPLSRAQPAAHSTAKRPAPQPEQRVSARRRFCLPPASGREPVLCSGSILIRLQ